MAAEGFRESRPALVARASGGSRFFGAWFLFGVCLVWSSLRGVHFFCAPVPLNGSRVVLH